MKAREHFSYRGRDDAEPIRAKKSPPKLPDPQPLTVLEDFRYTEADITNIGPGIVSRSVRETEIFTDNDSKTWILINYGPNAGLVVVDADAGTQRTIDGEFNTDKIWRSVYLDSVNKVFFMDTSNRYIYLVDQALGAITNVKQATTGTTGTVTGFLKSSVTTDGKVVFTSGRTADLYLYDPVLDVLTELGNPYPQYSQGCVGNAVGGDADFLYVVYRRIGVNWIVEYNISLGTFTEISSESDGYTSGSCFLYTNDSGQDYWFLNSSNTSGATTYEVRNGVAGDYGGNNPNFLNDFKQFGGMVYETEAQWLEFGYDRDLTGITGALDGVPKIKYKKTADANFTTVANDIELTPERYLSCDNISESEILLSAEFYGPIGILDVENEQVTEIREINNIDKYYSKEIEPNKVIIGGYANSTVLWDRSQAWDYGTNPYLLNSIQNQNAFYHYGAAQMGNKTYIGQEIIRNEFSASIAGLNLDGSGDKMTQDTKDILEEYTFTQVITTRTKRLIYNGSPRGSKSHPALIVWNLTKDRDFNNITPDIIEIKYYDDNTPCGKVFDIGNDCVIGFYSRTIYKVDLNSGVTQAWEMGDSMNLLDQNAVLKLSDDKFLISYHQNNIYPNPFLAEFVPSKGTWTKTAEFDIGGRPRSRRSILYNSGKVVFWSNTVADYGSITDYSNEFNEANIEFLNYD